MLHDYPHPWHYASADEATSGQWLCQQWEAFRTKLITSRSPEALLVIDEIQKIPEWSNLEKSQWDRDSFQEIPLKVVLLGSSGLIIRKGLSESLLTFTGSYQQVSNSESVTMYL